MTRGPYLFVAFVYLILAAAFMASTGLLISEFWNSDLVARLNIPEFSEPDWMTMVMAHSHLFLFFPIFGLVALAAFYLPSVVFTHMYWHHVKPAGRLRFMFGIVVATAVSLFISHLLTSAELRGIWEVSPQALARDRGVPPGCGAENGPPCDRAPLITALAKVRAEGPGHMGLSDFARSCRNDPLLPPPQSFNEPRYCFAALRLLPGAECCRIQRELAAHLARLSGSPATRSRASVLDNVFLPFKVFFVTVMIAVASMLAFWRDRIDTLYGTRVRAIERGVIVGAAAMLFWPIMDYGYQQTSDLLFGKEYGAFKLRWSLVIAPWALLLLFFFLRKLGKNLEMVGQMGGILGGFFAVLRYQDINNWAQRFLGSGAEQWIFFGLVALAIVGLVALLWPIKQVEDEASAAEEGSDPGSGETTSSRGPRT